MKTKNITIKRIIALSSIATAAVWVGGCTTEKPDATSVAELKTVSLDVVNSAGETKHYEDKTKAVYLREFMDELKEDGDFTYEGSESTTGVYIESVNNESANYDKDKAYWAIYVNGEYGNNGADTQTVSDGDVFKLVYEKSN